jgi:type II pantothenate kinase
MNENKVVIGIDIGGSTTKIVGFTTDGQFIQPIAVRATDAVTSVYGAFGNFTASNSIDLKDVLKIMVTGVGSTYITKPIYGIECEHVKEFTSIGLGGMYLSKLDKTIVVSMGTGTAIVYADKEKGIVYLGGTGVGGGTLSGLAKLTLGMDNIDHILGLATNGDIDKIDLRIKDITNKDIIPGLPDKMTAANFGKISDLATKGDIALGIINMIYEIIGMQSIFAARNYDTKNIILTGRLSNSQQAVPIFATLGAMFNFNFVIPDNSQYGPVIGAALSSKIITEEA